jgi:hypothetical protein
MNLALPIKEPQQDIGIEQARHWLLFVQGLSLQGVVWQGREVIGQQLRECLEPRLPSFAGFTFSEIDQVVFHTASLLCGAGFEALGLLF